MHERIEFPFCGQFTVKGRQQKVRVYGAGPPYTVPDSTAVVRPSAGDPLLPLPDLRPQPVASITGVSDVSEEA